jgi:hypothetical protein
MRDHGRPFDRIGSDNCPSKHILKIDMVTIWFVAEIYNVVVSGKL